MPINVNPAPTAPLLTRTIAGGFSGEKRELTVLLVRILFPGAALLVTAAWCLGVLNSHGKFLLSYASGMAWNAGMIGARAQFRMLPALKK